MIKKAARPAVMIVGVSGAQQLQSDQIREWACR